jgi:hypothetical protein
LRNTRLISQDAIAHLLTTEQAKDELPFTPSNLRKYGSPPQDLERYAMPMIHPITGKSISSYKGLMDNPATVDTWMMAFGKDFGGMCQGNNKTGQQGNKCNVCHAPIQHPKHPQRQSHHIRAGDCQSLFPKSGSQPNPNHSQW